MSKKCEECPMSYHDDCPYWLGNHLSECHLPEDGSLQRIFQAMIMGEWKCGRENCGAFLKNGCPVCWMDMGGEKPCSDWKPKEDGHER